MLRIKRSEFNHFFPPEIFPHQTNTSKDLNKDMYTKSI